MAPGSIAERLAEATGSEWHAFWPDEASPLKPVTLDWHKIIGSRRITDAYLPALAVHRDARFVSFDRRISPASVPGVAARHPARID